MNELTNLPNIGPAVAEKLTAAGIMNYEDLVSLGSVEVLLRVRGSIDPGACTSMLYAIEGAIRGVRWHTIPKADRQKLVEELDAAVRNMP